MPKKREQIGNFGTVDPNIYQDYTKIVNIFICDNIYGPAWGGIQSFPRKGLFLKGGIVKQGAHIYKLETYIYIYIYVHILMPGCPKQGNI